MPNNFISLLLCNFAIFLLSFHYAENKAHSTPALGTIDKNSSATYRVILSNSEYEFGDNILGDSFLTNISNNNFNYYDGWFRLVTHNQRLLDPFTSATYIASEKNSKWAIREEFLNLFSEIKANKTRRLDFSIQNPLWRDLWCGEPIRFGNLYSGGSTTDSINISALYDTSLSGNYIFESQYIHYSTPIFYDDKYDFVMSSIANFSIKEPLPITRLFFDNTQSGLLLARIDVTTVVFPSPIILKLIVSNPLSAPFMWSFTASKPELDYEFIVKDSKGEVMPLLKYARQIFASKDKHPFETINLKPGQALEEGVYINRLFDMSVQDAYTIEVKRKITNGDKELLLTAPPVKVSVKWQK